VAQAVEEAVRLAEGNVISPEHLELPDLPGEYTFVWSREGKAHRARGSEIDRARLESQEWSLVMHSRHDGLVSGVHRVVGDGSETGFDDPRLGRVLHLLASRAGEPVELARLKPALGIDRSAQTKRFIMLLRQALGDTEVRNRSSRFFESHYSEAYAFRTEEDFLLIADPRKPPNTGQ